MNLKGKSGKSEPVRGKSGKSEQMVRGKSYKPSEVNAINPFGKSGKSAEPSEVNPVNPS